ncbi:MAG: type I secretion system permease/ATPase [Pseudomonadota bacterium]
MTEHPSSIAAETLAETDIDLTADDATIRSNPGLAEALVRVAQFHGIAANRDDLLARLPADDASISHGAILEAAEKIGLAGRIDGLSIDRIPALTFPVVLFSKSGQAIVLHRIASGRRAEIFAAEAGRYSRFVNLDTLRSDYSGYCLFLTPSGVTNIGETDIQDGFGGVRTDQTGGARWFWHTVSHFWPDYGQVALASLAVNILALASPLFVMNVYDRVIPNLAIPTLWALTAGIGIAILFDFIMKLMRSSIVDQAGRRVDMAISGRLFDHLLALRLQAQPVSTGVISNQVREFDNVRDILTSNSVVAVMDMAFIAIFLAVMWALVGPLALVPAAAVPIVIILTLIYQVPLDRAVKKSQADAARRHGVLVETIGGLETVKSIGAAPWLRRAWDGAVAATSRSTTAARFWSNMALTTMSIIQQGVSVVIIVWGVFLVLDGSITVGALIATNILAGRVLAPLANIAQTLSRFSQARTALKGVNAIMQLPADKTISQVASSRAPGTQAVAFRGVSMSYPGAPQPSLKDVSFSISAGERVGIIGRIGSGKSTLGKAAAGLIDVDEGTVLLNGSDIGQASLAQIRKTIVYCGQEADLFTGSLRENIVIGRPFASDDEIAEVTSLSGVSEFAAEHPQGLDMPIIERGRNLSGGQRQSVSIARALIHRPEVLFLDEPTASMDSTSERALLEALKNISAAGTTLVIATHKESVISLVDRLIFLDRGHVRLDGPKDKVVATLKDLAKQRAGG